jgi:hypothetical protein
VQSRAQELGGKTIGVNPGDFIPSLFRFCRCNQSGTRTVQEVFPISCKLIFCFHVLFSESMQVHWQFGRDNSSFGTTSLSDYKESSLMGCVEVWDETLFSWSAGLGCAVPL